MIRRKLYEHGHNVVRQKLFTAVLVVIVGGILAIGARIWVVGGLDEQRAQLHQCVITSRHSHPNEDTRSTVAHLDKEVPECMEGAGYEKALNNHNCSLAVWQGDVNCYLPRSLAGKLIYRVAVMVR